MKIADFDLDKNILIVAEIGNNHEGSFALAEEMVHLAAKAGARAVKFQAIVPERLVSVRRKKRIRQLEKFRFSAKELEKLSKTARKDNLLFLCTVFDIESISSLQSIAPAFKIASGDNDFFPLRAEDANLLAIKTLSEQVGGTVGYSDHTLGIDACVLSVVLGARIIEKHFTIDKNYSDFHDHKISADPEDFTLLVKKVKQTVKMLGEILGKALTRPIRAGDLILLADVCKNNKR